MDTTRNTICGPARPGPGLGGPAAVEPGSPVLRGRVLAPCRLEAFWPYDCLARDAAASGADVRPVVCRTHAIWDTVPAVEAARMLDGPYGLDGGRRDGLAVPDGPGLRCGADVDAGSSYGDGPVCGAPARWEYLLTGGGRKYACPEHGAVMVRAIGARHYSTRELPGPVANRGPA